MTDKEKIRVLKNCFDNVAWMAVRYAHGRHTTAPSTVRQAVKSFQSVFPEWNLKSDKTILDIDGGMDTDSLIDLFD